jgi:hypothetical protein
VVAAKRNEVEIPRIVPPMKSSGHRHRIGGGGSNAVTADTGPSDELPRPSQKKAGTGLLLIGVDETPALRDGLLELGYSLKRRGNALLAIS